MFKNTSLKTSFLQALSPSLSFFLIVSFTWSFGALFGWVQYKLFNRIPFTPVEIPGLDNTPNISPIVDKIYVVVYEIYWLIFPFFLYLAIPKQQYYSFIKKTLIAYAIILLIYITCPTYSFKLSDADYQPLATRLNEIPSCHVANTLILCLAAIPNKNANKTNNKILFGIALALTLAVYPLAIFTKRHYAIDLIISTVVIGGVWIIFSFYKQKAKSLEHFFEVTIVESFDLNKHTKSNTQKKYLFFTLLGGIVASDILLICLVSILQFSPGF